MTSAIHFINEVLQLQIADIYQEINRKQMNSASYRQMKQRHTQYEQQLQQAEHTEEQYRIINLHSQYMFQYLVRQLNKEAQSQGSKERIRVKNWHKGSVGYKNSLRNYMSTPIKNTLAEFFPLPFDPDNPALINTNNTTTIEKITLNNNKTKWIIDNDSFIPEHPHVLLLELAELCYPGIVILVTAFETLNSMQGLQYSIALRLLHQYLDTVMNVLDQLHTQVFQPVTSPATTTQLVTTEQLLTQLSDKREQFIRDATLLSDKFPRRIRTTEQVKQPHDSFAIIEHELLSSAFSLQLDQSFLQGIQQQATEQTREQSSRFHEEILYLNEYPGRVLYQQILHEPFAFLYHYQFMLAAEVRVFHQSQSGAIDLLIGTTNNTYSEFLPQLIIDRKAVAQYHVGFTSKTDKHRKNKRPSYHLAPDLEVEAYDQETFRSLLHSDQLLNKEKGYAVQLQFYRQAVQHYQPQARPLLGILYYDLGCDESTIADHEKKLLLSTLGSLRYYKGQRLVLSHPELSSVRLVILGRVEEDNLA